MLRAFGVLIAALIGLTVSLNAHAQSQPIYQSGLMTPRHVLAWATNGVAEDPEQVSIGGLSQLTLTNTGTPFCINDALTTAQGGYHQFCIGANSLGGGLISYQAYGGATPLALQCNINGTILPCFPSGGNVTASTSPAPVAGNAAKWGGGTVLLDAGIPPSYQVDTIAALKALPLTLLANGVAVQVNGYWAKGQAPPVVYRLSISACSLNGGSGDGGSQIPSATSGNCWLKLPSAGGILDSLNWGASGSALTTTCAMTQGFPAATLGGAEDFVNGEAIFCIGAGATFTAAAPSLGASSVGGSGTTRYYTIMPIDAGMGVGPAVTPVSTSGGATLGTPKDLSATSVYDELAISGSTPSYAVYEGSSATLADMTCIAVTAAAQYPTAGVWDNYGSTHYQVCPSWVPAVPSATPQNDVLRTTIASGAGGTSVVLAAPAINTTSGAIFGHDDTTPIQNALTFGGPLNFSGCGTYNILADLVPSSPGAIDGLSCATIAGWGTSDDFALSPAASAGLPNGSLLNLAIDDSQKAAGYEISTNTGIQVGNSFIIDHITGNSPFNGLYITHSNNIIVRNYLTGNPRGDHGIYVTGSRNSSPSTLVETPLFDKIGVGQSTSAVCLDLNGDVESTAASNFTCQQAPVEVVFRNDAGGTIGPHYGDFIKLSINFAWGIPLRIMSNQGPITFDRMYLQGNIGNAHPGIYIAPGVDPVSIVGGTQIFGNDKDGIEDHGNYLQTDNTTMIFSNSSTTPGTYDKVALESDALGANIQLAAGDRFTGASESVVEKCGVSIASGFGDGVFGFPLAFVTTAGPGMKAPVCDNTGVVGQVNVNGNPIATLNSDTTTSGDTLLAAQMVPIQAGGNAFLYRSGPTAGYNDTTPAASAMLALIPNNQPGMQWTFTYVNLGSHTGTLLAGANVTIGGTATTAKGVLHPFLCSIDSGGSSITCTGS